MLDYVLPPSPLRDRSCRDATRRSRARRDKSCLLTRAHLPLLIIFPLARWSEFSFARSHAEEKQND